MKHKRMTELAAFTAVPIAVWLICICTGSVNVPLGETLKILFGTAFDSANSAIILSVRLPRTLCAALVGASLSLCGAAMQGLLKNPLAEGSILGVASGASLGAVLAIAFGITLPVLSFPATVPMAICFAFASLLTVLAIAAGLDGTLSTNTVILIGVIFSMFMSSLVSLVVTFASDKLRSISFWSMGSLSAGSYADALLLAVTLAVCSIALLSNASELNAFSIGEDNARSVGVDVKRVKLTVLIAASVLVGVCVSVSGTIGFVGLVSPHIMRMLVGADHRKLLPACMLGGAVLLMLCDLAARTLLSPRELPVGVVSSIIGAALFVVIFCRTGRGEH